MFFRTRYNFFNDFFVTFFSLVLNGEKNPFHLSASSTRRTNSIPYSFFFLSILWKVCLKWFVLFSVAEYTKHRQIRNTTRISLLPQAFWSNRYLNFKALSKVCLSARGPPPLSSSLKNLLQRKTASWLYIEPRPSALTDISRVLALRPV